MSLPLDLLVAIVRPLALPLAQEVLGLVKDALGGADKSLILARAERIKNLNAAKAGVSAAAAAKRESLKRR